MPRKLPIKKKYTYLIEANDALLSTVRKNLIGSEKKTND